MSQFVLFAMPNHLRPSASYKGLQNNQIETPRNFKDRVYLTDIVETIWRAVSSRIGNATIKMQSRKGYFPWKIRIKIDDANILLQSRIYGDTTWASAVKIIFDVPNDLHLKQFRMILKDFISGLQRLPYESPYWTDETWQKFREANDTTRRQVENSWAVYLV